MSNNYGSIDDTGEETEGKKVKTCGEVSNLLLLNENKETESELEKISLNHC